MDSSDEPSSLKKNLLILLIVANCVITLLFMLFLLAAMANGNLMWILVDLGLLAACAYFLLKKLKSPRKKVYTWTIVGLIGSFIFANVVTDNVRRLTATTQEQQTPVSNSETHADGANQANEVKEDSSSAHKVGELVSVGYTNYRVINFSWRKRVGNPYVGRTADARYLQVQIQVSNNDKESRMIPPFHLIDENGLSYDESADKVFLGEEASFLSSLNPGVTKRTKLLFDIPSGHRYNLLLDGGYWSNEQALIQLN